MSDAAKEIEGLVEAVIDCTSPITHILQHLARAPDPPSPQRATEVIRDLMADAFAPLAARASPAELRTAARLLHAATDLLVGEVFLVPHPPRRAQLPPLSRRGCA